MYKKILKSIALVLFLAAFIAVWFYLDVLIDEKYTNKIPKLFLTIWYIILIASIEIDRRMGKKRIYSISVLVLCVLMQTLVFLIPEFHEFIYNLFK